MEIKVEYPDFVPWWLQIGLSLAIFGGMCALWLGSSIWALRDANTRGKSGCLVGILVFLTWPLGLLFWIVARPTFQAPSQPPPLPGK